MKFCGDDRVGGAVIAFLRERAQRHPLPDGVTLATSDGEPALLLSLWEGTGTSILIDAARTRPPGQPGRVRRLELQDVLGRPELGAASSHGLGLAAAIELAHVLERLPQGLIVCAAEGCEFGLGLGLSAAVSAAADTTARLVEQEVSSLVRGHAALRTGPITRQDQRL